MSAIAVVRTGPDGLWYIDNPRVELFLMMEVNAQFYVLDRREVWENGFKDRYDRYVCDHPTETVRPDESGINALLERIASYEPVSTNAIAA